MTTLGFYAVSNARLADMLSSSPEEYAAFKRAWLLSAEGAKWAKPLWPAREKPSAS